MADRFVVRFSEGLRRTLTLAQEEAIACGAGMVGGEHLLLALCRDQRGPIIALLLEGKNDRVVRALRSLLGWPSRLKRPVGEVGLSPRAKKIIELTVAEADAFGLGAAAFIGREHLLLAISREGEGIGAGVLDSLGISYSDLTARLQQLSPSRIGPELRAMRTEEDARVMACVDACEGLPLDLLQSGGIRKLIAAAERIFGRAGEPALRSGENPENFFEPIMEVYPVLRRIAGLCGSCGDREEEYSSAGLCYGCEATRIEELIRGKEEA